MYGKTRLGFIKLVRTKMSGKKWEDEKAVVVEEENKEYCIAICIRLALCVDLHNFKNQAVNSMTYDSDAALVYTLAKSTQCNNCDVRHTVANFKLHHARFMSNKTWKTRKCDKNL